MHTDEKNYFDTAFDFEAYIRERLLDIADMDDRAAMKKLMENVMIPFYKSTEAQYNALVESIRTEKVLQNCNITTAIAKKQEIDSTDSCFFPVCEEDMADGLRKPPRFTGCMTV